MMQRFFHKVQGAINRWVLNNYIVAGKKQEGVVRNGAFSPVNFETHDIIDRTKYLVVEKGKYRITSRGERTADRNDPTGMFVIDNSCDSYNKFWASDRIIERYLDSGRRAFYETIVDSCKEHFHGKIIDVGCGSGDFLSVVSKQINCQVHGLDFSGSSIERCRNLIPAGEFVLGDIYMTGYKANVYDVVCCIEVLEHLENPEIAFKELRRICKSGGVIIITIPNGAFDNYIGHLNFWVEQEFKAFIGGIKLISFRYVEDKRSMLFILEN